MANLYLVELEVQYQGVSFQDFLKTWLEDVNFYLTEEKLGSVKELWKVVGERKVNIVLEKSAGELDKLLFETPLMKKLGDQVKVTITQLLPYNVFGNQLSKLINSDATYQPTEAARKVAPKVSGGMHFWAELDIGYTGHTEEEFLQIWSEEVAAAFGAIANGIVLDVWKCVGIRRVHVLICVDSLDFLDAVWFSLPIMQKNGDNCELKLKALRRLDSFAETLKGITAAAATDSEVSTNGHT